MGLVCQLVCNTVKETQAHIMSALLAYPKWFVNIIVWLYIHTYDKKEHFLKKSLGSSYNWMYIKKHYRLCFSNVI